MTKLKNAFIATMVIIGLAFVSCENDKIDTIAEEETSAISGDAVDNELNATQNDNVGLLQRRSSVSYSNWVEKEDISNLRSGYVIKDVYNYKERNSFYFCVLPKSKYSALKDTEIYLKTYSPSRKTVYTLMKYNEKNGRFEYETTFEESGVYYYRYFVRRYKNKNELTKLHDDSRKFTVTLLPTMQDNENYPYKYGTLYSDDKWGFFKRECVSYVAWKVNQMWGTETAFNNFAFSPRLSDAYKWKNTLEKYGYKVDNQPQPGDIAWWDSNVPGALSRGHVAFVEKVEPNGEITISEYNYYPSHVYNERTFNKSYKKYPTAFIHVQSRR